MLEIGKPVPDFHLAGHDGKSYAPSDFPKVILYFYPKDMTSGCTLHAQGYAALYEEFQKRGIVVLGISGDSLERHRKFVEKECLPFPLLSDRDFQVSRLYGVYGPKKMYGRDYQGIHRSSFYVENGILRIVRRDIPAKDDAENMLRSIDGGSR